LNGQFAITTREVLVGVIANSNAKQYAKGCYDKMVGFLDAWVKPAKWSGQIIAAGQFPTEAIVNDPALQNSWTAFQTQRILAYTSARDFVLEVLPSAPASQLARFSQPVVDTYFASSLDSAIEKQDVHAAFDSFKCNQIDVLSPALRDLTCFGVVEGSAATPLSTRWQDMLSAALIGPQSMRLIDTGIALASVADFARTDDNGLFVFVKPQNILNFSNEGATTEMLAALAEHKGNALMEKLRWLTEASVLQQSLTYGDYTAELIEHTLYDPSTRSLNTDASVPARQKALFAMRNNPILARNVVLLAMRHAISDVRGGRDKADAVNYSQTYYALALKEFTGQQACNGSVLAREKLSYLFPGWRFDYRITAQQQQDKSLAACPLEWQPDPQSSAPQPAERGTGVSVSVSDFYVLVPSPLTLSSGVFEQSDSLRLALAYRDRLSQAIIDRNIASEVRKVSGAGNDANTTLGITAFALLNEGWGWEKRTKSH